MKENFFLYLFLPLQLIWLMKVWQRILTFLQDSFHLLLTQRSLLSNTSWYHWSEYEREIFFFFSSSNKYHWWKYEREFLPSCSIISILSRLNSPTCPSCPTSTPAKFIDQSMKENFLLYFFLQLQQISLMKVWKRILTFLSFHHVSAQRSSLSNTS